MKSIVVNLETDLKVNGKGGRGKNYPSAGERREVTILSNKKGEEQGVLTAKKGAGRGQPLRKGKEKKKGHLLSKGDKKEKGLEDPA